MRIDQNSTVSPALGLDRVEDLRARIQLQLLKKQLELQKSTATEILSPSSGKGQTLDIRV